MTDLKKIPNYILNDARQNIPFSREENYSDEELSNMTKREIFDHYLNWKGLIGYSSTILQAVEDLFNVKLR